MSINETHTKIEQAVHDSYGRLLAFLSARSRNIAGSEDALGDAFCAALETWPHTGIPDKPEAWLLTVARRRLIDAARHNVVKAAAVALLTTVEEAQETAQSDVVFPDERLKLLFICAHPAIDASAHAPLMLQIVLGLSAARIASAFLVEPSTMGQKLTRAKVKIRDARIAFEIPDANELPARLSSVLYAIYAAYGSGWDDIAGADQRRKGLATEALSLGTLILQLLPAEPEAQGLVALMLFCEARREARRSDTGGYVPLSDQDMTRWSNPMITAAEQHLNIAASANRIGRFQLEAAIQSAHMQRIQTGVTDWQSIALLYEGLVRIAPAVGALIGRAAAVAEAYDAVRGWDLLTSIPIETVRTYQPYWALSAHLLKRMGRANEAADAYRHAIGLCEDPAMREFLINQALHNSTNALI